MSNQSVARRLREDIDSFRAGVLTLDGLQASVEGHSRALEGMDASWLRLSQRVEGRLDSLKFTSSADVVGPEVLHEVAQLEDYLGGLGL